MNRVARWILEGWIMSAGLLVYPMNASAEPVQGVEMTGRITHLAGDALNYPMAVRIGPGNDRYVLDSGNGRLLVTDEGGTLKQSWPLDLVGKSQFEAASDIAVDKSGNVYVADSVNNRVVKYSANGQRLLSIGQPGELDGPLGLAVADNGEIIVANTNNHSIFVYDAGGKLTRRFGSEGSGLGNLRFPHGIAVDAKGAIYVADFLNDRIAVFSAQGTPMLSFGAIGASAGQFNNPYGIALDGRERVWVTDAENSRVQVFTAQGTNAQVPISSGAGARLDHPKSVAITADGQVIVCNTGNHSVDIFRVGNL
jgi:DNA-binding beta-propeller fold protein YncE